MPKTQIVAKENNGTVERILYKMREKKLVETEMS